MSWHYRDADPDFGMSQAKNLHQHLDQVIYWKLLWSWILSISEDVTD